MKSVLNSSPLMREPYKFYNPSKSNVISGVFDASELGAGLISDWENKIDNTKNAIQASDALKPESGISDINGINALAFDGADSLTVPDDIIAMSNVGMLCVFKLNIAANFSIFSNSGSGASKNRTYFQSARIDLGDTQTPLISLDTNPHIQGGYINNANDGATQYFIRDGIHTEYTVNRDPNANLTTNQVCIGAFGDGAGSGGLNGLLGEIIIWNKEITILEIQKIEGYLAWKWGLVDNLPSNHPFKRRRP